MSNQHLHEHPHEEDNEYHTLAVMPRKCRPIVFYR